MGGGGSFDVGEAPQRSPGQEKKSLRNFYKFQEKQLAKFIRQDPLLKRAYEAARLGLRQAGRYAGQVGALGNQLGGLGAQLGTLQQGLSPQFNQLTGQLANIQQGLPQQFSQLTGQLANIQRGLPQISQLTNPLLGAYQGQISPVLASGGALTPALGRAAEQAALSLAGRAGMGNTQQGLASALLNREQYREARFANALGQARDVTGAIQGLRAGDVGLRSGLIGQQAGLIGQGVGLQSGLIGQQAGLIGQNVGLQTGLSGLRSGLIGQQAGLIGQQQGLQSAALRDVLGTEQTGVGSFATTTNPILSYLGNLFGGNLQAQVQNQALQSQAQQAAAGNKAGQSAGALSAVGSIAGAVGAVAL